MVRRIKRGVLVCATVISFGFTFNKSTKCYPILIIRLLIGGEMKKNFRSIPTIYTETQRKGRLGERNVVDPSISKIFLVPTRHKS